MKLWSTPFSDIASPAVQVIPSNEAAGSVDVLIYSEGLNSLPAYLVKFIYVPAYRSHYEGMMPSGWIFPPSQLSMKSSFIVENSKWIEEFRNVSSYIEAAFAKPFSELKHFVIIGGDNCVEAQRIWPFNKKKKELCLVCPRGWSEDC